MAARKSKTTKRPEIAKKAAAAVKDENSKSMKKKPFKFSDNIPEDNSPFPPFYSSLKFNKDGSHHLSFYQNAQELAYAIDDYFRHGIPSVQRVVGKGATSRLVRIPRPSIAGLCRHIGYQSRQSFYDLEEDDRFSYVIKRARLFLEEWFEGELQTGQVIGAIFALKQFGYSDTVKFDGEIKFKDGVTVVRPGTSESSDGKSW